MGKADWSYEVAPAGAPATGLEEYLVEDEHGELVGKVQTLLRRDADVFVAVERGNPPFGHDVRLVEWEQVRDVSQDDLRVRLALDSTDLDDALELDPDRGVENEDADLRRHPELPPELLGPVTPGPAAGPVDSGTYAAAIGVGAAGLLSLLALVVVLTTDGGGAWKFALFAIPAALFAVAGFLAWRAWREPYERRR